MILSQQSTGRGSAVIGSKIRGTDAARKPPGSLINILCRLAAVAVLLCAVQTACAQQAAQPCDGLPPGKHSLLERFTAQLGLTCEQQLKIEPLLHAEESVSKPLLAFAAFSAEEQQRVMLKIKLAARRQVRTLLTPDQQKKMDEEIQSVAQSASKGGKKGGAKKAPPKVDPFENEEALSEALANYAALTQDEKKAMVLEVKRAARRDNALGLSPEQLSKIDAGIDKLSKK